MKDTKELGTQIRSKFPGLDGILGQNVEFQTSGLRAGGAPSGIVTNPNGSGAQRLLGNLLQLVTNAGVANTIITFGQDVFGVWGLFQALRTITNLQVISNPFLVASNKTPAHVSLGETRRIISGTIISGSATNQDTFENDKAELKVDIEPQINSDGMIILKLRVELTEFTNPNDPQSGNKSTKLVKTQAVVADREVLALGGLIRNTTSATLSKTPLLGDIPVLGWLFKNKRKDIDKDSLLILISSRIIPPHATSEVNKFTQEHLGTYRSTLHEIAGADVTKDPIHRLFFSESADKTQDIGEFLFARNQKTRRRDRKRREEKLKKRKAQEELTKNEPLKIMEQQEPVQIAQSQNLHTIAAPAAQSSPILKTSPILKKKRRTPSLRSYLSTPDSEKTT